MNARIAFSDFPSTLLNPDALLDRVEEAMSRLVQVDLQPSPLTPPSAAVAAALYHLQSGGRRIRARLALHAGIALGLSADNCVALASVAELLHNASLVHDDLQDRDQFRRGVKTVWYALGDNIALCAGDLLLSSAYGALGDFAVAGKPQLLSSLLRFVQAATSAAIRGQCADLAFKGAPVPAHAVDMSAYERIAIAKSGALLSLPIGLVLVASEKSQFNEHAQRACDAFAIAYQIADDLQDVTQDAGGANAEHPSLNALVILRACGHGEDSLRLACTIALAHLAKADAAAAQLPGDAGRLLREYGHKLSCELTNELASTRANPLANR